MKTKRNKKFNGKHIVDIDDNGKLFRLVSDTEINLQMIEDRIKKHKEKKK